LTGKFVLKKFMKYTVSRDLDLPDGRFIASFRIS
jgi:hypothetical protein